MWKRIRGFLTRGNRSESNVVTLSSKKSPEDPELPKSKHRNRDNETSETEAQDVEETSTEQATENTGKREDSGRNEEARKRIETRDTAGDSETSDTVLDSETSDTVLDSETSDTVSDSETSDTVSDSETSDTVSDSETSDTVLDSETSDTVSDSETSDTVLDSETSDTVSDSETSDTHEFYVVAEGFPGPVPETDLSPNQPNEIPQKKVTICVWNTKTDLSWIYNQLTMYSSIKGVDLITCVPLFLITEEKVMKEVIDSSLFIICYCDHSEELEDDMVRFLNLCIKQNGTQSFLMIMAGFINDESKVRMRCTWGKSQFSECQLLLFSKSELESIDHLLLSSSSHPHQRVQKKLNLIRRILLSQDPPPKPKAQIQNRGQPIGIFSPSTDRWKWLQTALTETLSANEVKFIHRDLALAKSNKSKIRKLSRCPHTILHITKKFSINLDLISLFDKQAVVVIDGVEDNTLLMSIQEKLRHGGFNHVFEFSEEEKSSYLKFSEHNNEENKTKIQRKLSKLEKLVSNKVNLNENSEEGEHLTSRNTDRTMHLPFTIGIFSRSAECDYKWLQSMLRTGRFSEQFKDVQSFHISNNQLLNFLEDVSMCRVGILYHTKNRGGVNVTDITDALYDMELKLMADRLGKENVLVVVDDVDDSSSEEKERILESQPSIEEYAGDLLLVTEMEKREDANDLYKKLQELKSFRKDIYSTGL